MATQFRETWVVDFEYRQPDGELPEIRCMVAVELASGNKFKLWANELANIEKPPFSIGKDSLMVAYYATAELNCFRALDWPMPQNILDLYAEFKWKFCGKSPPAGFGLLGRGQARYGTARCCKVRMLWSGIVWPGEVWSGGAWSGMVRTLWLGRAWLGNVAFGKFR